MALGVSLRDSDICRGICSSTAPLGYQLETLGNWSGATLALPRAPRPPRHWLLVGTAGDMARMVDRTE